MAEGRNEFLPFATDSSANVMEQGAYEAFAQRGVGQSGKALAELNNKALRRASAMVCALGQLIAENGMNALDDGNIDALSYNLKTVIQQLGVIPNGLISMWSGALADIPSGWALCDGENGRPNLTDKFVKGIATTHTEPGLTGGSHSMLLTVDNMPTHTHTFTGTAHTHAVNGSTGSTSVNHQHYVTNSTTYQVPFFDPSHSVAKIQVSKGSGYYIYSTTNANGTYTDTYTGSALSDLSHSHNLSVTSNSVTAAGTNSNIGGGAAFDNRPAFYELAFIIKV